MGDLFKYSGLFAKIKAMQSYIFTRKDYMDMSHMSDVKQLALYLKECPAYSNALSDIDENDIHREQIEKKLIYSMYRDYVKIYKFTDGNDRKFLDSYFIYFEIDIIKLLLRMFFDSREIKYELKDFEKFFNEHSSIDIRKLSKAQTFSDFIECLKGTDYYNILNSIQNIENINLFDIEMQLDLYYFKQTWKLKDKYLNGTNEKVVSRTFGVRLDLLNMLWIYRARIYYSVDRDTIYSYIIPIKYKLKAKDLKQMIEAKSVDELKIAIENTYYAKYISVFEGDYSEKIYFYVLSKLHQKVNAENPMSIAPIRYFMFCKKNEIANLTRVIEGIRYGLKSERIMDYLSIFDSMGSDKS